MIKELVDIKMEPAKIGKILDVGNPTPDLIRSIKGSKEKKQKILHIQEVTWRLKSRELWLKRGT